MAGPALRIPLRLLLALGLALLVLTVGVTAWWGLFGMRSLNEKLALAHADLFERARLMNEARSALSGIDRATLNHVLASVRSEMEACEVVVRESDAVFSDRLQRLSAQPLTPRGRQLLDSVSVLAGRIEPVRQRMLLLSAAGRDGEVLSLRQQQWKPVVEEMDAAMAAFAAFQDARLDAERRDAGILYRRSVGQAVAAVCGVLVLALLAYALSTGLVNRALRDFIQATQEFARGNFGHRIRPQAGRELSRLAGALNTMAEERQRSDAERERLTEELRRKNEELEQIVYAASHDLRSPLVSVEGFTSELKTAVGDLLSVVHVENLPEPLLERVSRIVEHEIPEAVNYIEAGTRKMSSLLDGLLRLSRLGRVPVKLEELDMNGLVAQAVAALGYASRQAGATVEVGELPRCRGDGAMVGQVFSNLLENAVKYRTPKRAPFIRVTGRRQGALVEYCVEDNGVGIPPRLHGKVFELFHQVDPRGSPGEGLGLAIVTRILGRLGGSVRLESEPGEGSRFYVSLPAA